MGSEGIGSVQQDAAAAMTLREFCDRHSVSRMTAHREMVAGRLRAVKAGRRVLIRAEDARAWLAALPGARVGG
ncbi:excisionase family DNA binding protein [Prosthecomicrobium pneumaticum]|uniref:Excisionase family DNA binding protein n=1 Tax=Prosthecomicrobium pneumaticum TaxID=81895 RepID=A0A7W9FPW5_9HYPH|nr:excisionase family DNA binding protein [Prosthecomicrobium pneumaticum]